MMRTHLLIIVGLLLNLSAGNRGKPEVNAQNNPCNLRGYEMPLWCDGFVVLASGDTILGKIKQESFYESATAAGWRYFMVFASEKTCEIKYKAFDLMCFQYIPTDGPWIVDANKIKSLKIWSKKYGYPENEHQPYDHFVPMHNDIDPNNGEKEIFMQELKRGARCSVYGFEKIVYLGAGMLNNVIYEHKCCLCKSNGYRNVVEKKDFKTVMSKYFGDCPELVAKIRSDRYTYKNWPEMVAFYNDSCRSDVLPGVH